jgi:mersacidin/lichenicidin family type 2 lantibiotic
MTTNEIVRSWKDEDYRSSLNGEKLALIPNSPAGLMELTDEELLGVDGADTVVICVATIYATAAITVLTALSVVSYFHCR